MKKRVLSLILVVSMIVVLVPTFGQNVHAAGLTLEELKQKFPAGRYWNGGNPDKTTGTPCIQRADGSHPDIGDADLGSSPGDNYWCGACQCYGFALKLAYDANGITSQSHWSNYGFKKLTGSSAINSLKPGDIIRFGDEKAGHSIFVTNVDGNSFTFADCNNSYNCNIRWDETRAKSDILVNGRISREAFSYILSSPNQLVSNAGNNPIITLDSVDSPAPGKIHVRGWAFDSDNLNGAVPIHVYSGNTFIGAADANTLRTDVNDVYHCGNNHGFDAVFNTGLSGTINVRVAAINAYGGGNTSWSDEKSVTVAADKEQPKISDVQITNRSSTGFTITCTVTDNVAIKEVKFPTWTEPDGQDDLVWHTGTVTGNTATCRINVSDHKDNVNCIYITDIYAYDLAGNATMFRTSFGVDATPPIISNVRIENVSDAGYDIYCTVTDDDQAGIDKVFFPTWTAKDNQDDLVQPWRESKLYVGSIEGDQVHYRVNTSDHNKETGYYHTHIYAYDASGNSTWLAVDAFIGDISEREQHIFNSGTFNGNQYIVFSNEAYWSAASTYCQSLGGHLVSINSKEENEFVLSLIESGNFAYWIGANDIATEGTFVWDNGEAFDYSNWRVGEPNNDGDQDCCLIMAYGTWDDERVNATYPFIMEIENYHPEHTCELRNASPATCTKDGYTGDQVCTVCGETIQKGSVIKATGHKWDTGEVTKQPTETAEGLKTFTCTVCGATRTESIPKLTHTHKLTAVAKVPATCTQNGTEAYWKCSGCGKLFSDAQGKNEINAPVVIKATGHSWDNGKVTKAATCTEAGVRTYTCKNDSSHTRTEAIPTLGHDYKTVVTPPTCTERGYTKHTCSRCGDSYVDSYVDAFGHKTQLRNAKAATCIVDGYTGDEVCTVCGETVKKGSVIKATGHKWDDGKVTKQPTETLEGVKTFTCTVCGETRTVPIPKLTHTHNYTDVVTPPTCTEQGYTTHICADCGESYVDSYVNALGHKTELRNAKAATCTADGYTGDEICSVCGVTVKQGTVIKATGHKWDNGKVTKEPTETAEGVKTFTCTICGETRTEAIPKLTPVTPPAPTNPFVDVKQGEYYYDPVLWAVNHQPQITNGTSATTFSPDATCTRGQVVTFLWRANGCPEPKSTSNPFADVASDAYYYKAVLWAVENSITNGTSSTTFSPEDPCTRAHVVTFLWRSANKPTAGSTNPFHDVAAGQYYTDAVLWAVSKNITNGTSATTFSPDNPCTRGQIVTFLYRYMK